MPASNNSNSAISSSAPPTGMLELQLEAVADAVGAILAQQRREWSLEHAAFIAEQRAMIADLRRENAELRAELRAAADEQAARVTAALTALKGGEPGEKGDVGPEGAAGRDGRDGLPGVPGAGGEKGLDGKDGRDGIDGKDGLGFDDLDIAHDGERGFTFMLCRGEAKKEWRYSVPAQIYRGVYGDGGRYERGDTVTWGGSLYHCNEPTTDKPGAGSTAWTLAAKRGQDGKDGKPGIKGDPGATGRPGRDLTQMAPDGSKWG